MVIFVAHGSRNPKWRASVEALIESLQANLGCDEVQLAYMEHGPPTLVDVASRAIDAGATSIRVMPLFLADAGHVERDIRPMVERLRERSEQVEVELLAPLGRHRGFRDLLHEIAAGNTAETPR